MTGNELVPVLMFMTLGAGLLFGVGALLWFLRKRRNREAYVDAFTDNSASPDADASTPRDMTGHEASARQIRS